MPALPAGKSPSAFERRSVPLAEVGGCFVGVLQELEQVAVVVLGGAHGLVGQDELFEVLVVVGALGADLRVLEALWLGVCVGVKDWLRERGAAGPEAGARNFVRVSLARDGVGDA